jgi:hypothetical protein
MFDTLELPLKENSHIVSLTLLARSICNFESSVILLKAKRIVEARILVRCCYENLFYIAGIAKDGNKFLRKMLDDELATKRARGERVLQSKLLEEGSDVEDRLRKYLRTLDKAAKRTLDPKNVAERTAISDGYHIYMQVSADAAHPTITSLSRHVLRDQETGFIDELNIAPDPEAEELLETIDYACGALIGVCYGLGEILGGSLAAPEIKARLSELRKLKGLSDEAT